MSVNQDSEVSLQSAFEAFRKRKSQEIRLQMTLAEQTREKIQARTELEKSQLRVKFVEEAYKYIGVPYHEKYRDVDQPLAPLYLDCCGLVRQCARNMHEDFGFFIGNWNQSYQYDILPKIVTSPSDLKIGDLIFYEGNYVSSRSKLQKHNIVHVEIFIGGDTNEATIGARYQRGTIQIFPSYKFESTKWTLVKHHFRSLDPWLEGSNKSCCPEHSWQSSEIANIVAGAGSRSIFSMENCNDDEAAEQSDDDDDDSNNDENNHSENNRNYLCNSSTLPDDTVKKNKTDIDLLVTNIQPLTATTTATTTNTPPITTTTKSKKPSRVLRSSSETNPSLKQSLPLTYYVGKSNGWKLVKESLDRRGWQQLPFDYNFSTRFNLKWVERRSQIDYKAHTAGQLVNHIPNNDCISTKLQLLDTMRSFYCKPTHLQHSLISNNNNNNNITSPLPNQETTTTTTRMITTSAGHTTHKNNLNLPPWLPETYELEDTIDRVALLRSEETTCALTGAPGLWIYKPASSNRGRGVRVIRGKESLLELCGQSNSSASSSSSSNPPTFSSSSSTADHEVVVAPGNDVTRAGSITATATAISIPTPTTSLRIKPVPTTTASRSTLSGIIQRYIERPLLADGFKFDIRCYMLVARNDPSYLVYYHPGYCRLTLEKYSIEGCLDDPLLHLTNAAIQKKHPSYDTQKENQIRSPQALADLMEQTGDLSGAEYIRKKVDDDIKLCMVDVLKAAIPKLSRKRGYFDLFGLDFMIAIDNPISAISSSVSTIPSVTTPSLCPPPFRLLLLEVNTNPALSLDNSTLAALLPGVVDSTLEIVIQANDGGCCPSNIGNFQLIADEAKSYYFSLG